MKKIGIYIHIPFCKKKCKYCDFLSFENCKFVKEYIDRLLWDIDNINEILIESKIGALAPNIIVDTIYFGGGTPSFINAKYISQILYKLRSEFIIEEDAEITIEVNPGTVDYEKLQSYFNVGFNRLSIGCQEVHDNILQTIGRIHNYEEFVNTYKMARNIGFKNINVDLMLGLPKQTINDLKESVNKIMHLNPNHISLYSLILEDGTKLQKEIDDGILSIPSEEIERKMYHETKKILEENGYIHYEISNFAREGFFSKHNLNCWNQHEYLGFGLGSSSYFNKKRFSNETNFQKYIEKSSEQAYNKIVVVNEIQDIQEEMKEFVMLGFRKLEGISKSKFNYKFKKDINRVFNKEILKLKSESLIEENRDYLKLTLKGLDLANLVFEEFI